MNERILKLFTNACYNSNYDPENVPNEIVKELAESIVRECAYHADVFSALGCPLDMYPTETKPSDYIKRQFGVQ